MSFPSSNAFFILTIEMSVMVFSSAIFLVYSSGALYHKVVVNHNAWCYNMSQLRRIRARQTSTPRIIPLLADSPGSV